MRAPALLALLLLTSGCATAPDQAATPNGPSVVTAPDDYSYLANGTDSGAHLHDYWGQADRLTVVDDTVRQAGPGMAGGTSFLIHAFQPPSGNVIPLGASHVEITIDWTDAVGDMYANPELWVKTAADHEATLVGPATPGQTLPVNTTNDQNDLPHQLLSAWEFQFRLSAPPPPQPFLRFKGDVTLKAVAVRGLEIPLFPAHPDAWHGADRIQLLDETGDLAYFHDVQDGGCNGIACPTTHTPRDGLIVPHNATTVEVTFEVTAAAHPTRIGLAYHSAQTRDFERLTPTTEQGNTRTYQIPVGAYGDGPYAKQSQWEFLPVVDGPVPDGAAVETYRLTATAIR